VDDSWSPALGPDLSGGFTTPSEAGDFSLLFSRAWAEKLILQIEASRDAHSIYRRKIRQAEYGEDWSPDDRQIEACFRRLWVENVALVWMAHQLEQWLQRLAVELGEEPAQPLEGLRLLRNALEHLDDAHFEEGAATAGSGTRNRSLSQLPGSTILVQSWPAGSPLYGLIEIGDLEQMALSLLDRLERELSDLVEDYVIQQRIDELRGK
jgi:hypothetical protein